MAETLTGETVKFYQHLAKDKNVWLSLGGIHELIHDEVIYYDYHLMLLGVDRNY